MVFEEGRQHTSLYETPFGELTVDIQTGRLRHNLSERGGVMEIQYSIAVEHTVTGRNRFKIRVRRKTENISTKEGNDMINMIQNAKDQAAALAMSAYQAAVRDGTLPQAEVKTAPVEIPKDTANGDFTTTFALAASKLLRQPPQKIAQALLDHMDLAGSYFASAEIAGPGF